MVIVISGPRDVVNATLAATGQRPELIEQLVVDR